MTPNNNREKTWGARSVDAGGAGGSNIKDNENGKLSDEQFVRLTDGYNSIVTGKEIIDHEHVWEQKQSFADVIYIREMRTKNGQLGCSAIHKHRQ